MKKLIKSIKSCFPVSKRKYEKDMKNLTTVLQGLMHSDAQHSQIEVNLMRAVDDINRPKENKNKKATTQKDIAPTEFYG